MGGYPIGIFYSTHRASFLCHCMEGSLEREEHPSKLGVRWIRDVDKWKCIVRLRAPFLGVSRGLKYSIGLSCSLN